VRQSSCHEIEVGMSIEINLLQASVTAPCALFPENIFSAVGKDFWLFANGGFKCDCRVSVGSHIARGFELEISLGKKLRVAHCSLAYSAFALMKTGTSASASFQSVRNS
jgi:hypothetical protein